MEGSRGQQGLLVDIDTGVLRRDHVLVQHAPGIIYFLGTGPRAERLRRFAFGEDQPPDPFIDRCRRAAEAIESGRLGKARRAGVSRDVLAITDRSLRRLAIAEALAKAGYNRDEPRDDHGRWTTGGSAASGVAPVEAALGAAAGIATNIGREAASLFDEVGPNVLADLVALGARFVRPAAFLGTLFIPTNSSLQQEGRLPGPTSGTYHYDLDTGTLTLSRDDGGLLYTGRADADGIFRDAAGHAVGRVVDGSIVLDPDALPGYVASSSAGPEARSRSTARPLSQTDEQRQEPEFCPAPTTDRPGARKPEQLYQAYISNLVNPGNGLPPGLAVRLPRAGLNYPPNPSKPDDWVYFDDCIRTDESEYPPGAMIDAKRHYWHLFLKGPGQPWAGTEAKLLKQAGDQIAAAGTRPIIWFFAERPMAIYIKKLFEEKIISIDVKWKAEP